MPKILAAIFCLGLFLLSPACLEKAIKEIETNKEKDGLRIIVEILPGPEWIHKEPFSAPPTFAVWAEDAGGNFIDTLYITKKAATQGWFMAGAGRKENSLPYWAHKLGIQASDGLYMPERDNPLPDAVTSATPGSDFTIYSKVNFNGGEIIVLAEFNHSLDFNSYFPDIHTDRNYDKENGQPSVVYAVKIDPARKGEYYLQPLGCGSLHGENGALNKEDLARLTTALSLVQNIKVIIP